MPNKIDPTAEAVPVAPPTLLDRLRTQLEDLSARHLAQSVKLREAQILAETEQGKLNKLTEELALADKRYVETEKRD